MAVPVAEAETQTRFARTWTRPRIARVRGVIAASSLAGSMQ